MMTSLFQVKGDYDNVSSLIQLKVINKTSECTKWDIKKHVIANNNRGVCFQMLSFITTSMW